MPIPNLSIEGLYIAQQITASCCILFINKYKQIEDIEGDFIIAIDKPTKNIYYLKDILKTPQIHVNVGLFIVGKKYNNLETFNKLIEIMHSKKRVKLPDQEIINSFFDNKNIVLLPLSYNRQVREFYPNNKLYHFKRLKHKEICLHFCGPKPWHGGIEKTSEMEKIWWQYYNNEIIKL